MDQHIQFHEKKSENINLKSQNILQLIITRKSEDLKKVDEKPTGYIKHKEIINLGDISGALIKSRIDIEKKTIEKFICVDDNEIGLEIEGFRFVYNLITELQKDTKLKSLISVGFLADLIFDWAIKAFTNKSKITLSEFIESNCNQSIQTYIITLPILFLETNAPFRIGKVEFKYFSKEYIYKLSESIDLEKRDKYIESLLKYKGQLFASCMVKAEKNQAIELGTKYINFAVDVLRTLSPTVSSPEFRIFYDVDYRCIHQLTRKIIVQKQIDESDIFISHESTGTPFIIDKLVWDAMLSLKLEAFHNFAFKILGPKTELETLIYIAIKNFSKAIINHDVHERVTQIFTVLESLLLPNEKSLISESIKKYLPKLVSSEIDERKEIIEVITKMYEVRSKMIHHGKKEDFEFKKLALLQSTTASLIIQLLNLTKNYNTKSEIILELENRILCA